jgi:hypothetical protein
MVFGHNTNTKIGNVTFHVQTEDRGESHALIDTTVYYRGRVLHRRTNNYFDLLPMNEDRQQALKLRLDEQHDTVLEEIHSGALPLAVPPDPAPAPALAAHPIRSQVVQEGATLSALFEAPANIPAVPRKLIIELSNPKSWLSGKHAALQISIREENGNPVAHASIAVEIEGSTGHSEQRAESGMDGQAQIAFDMPKITSAEAAMLIRVEQNNAHGQLRFALRAKPRVPSV